jgi:hypothetical protein
MLFCAVGTCGSMSAERGNRAPCFSLTLTVFVLWIAMLDGDTPQVASAGV